MNDKKEAILKPSELTQVQFIQNILVYRQNELKILEGGAAKIMNELAKAHNLPENKEYTLNDGVLKIVENDGKEGTGNKTKEGNK